LPGCGGRAGLSLLMSKKHRKHKQHDAPFIEKLSTPAVALQQPDGRIFSLSCFVFSRFTASNRQVAVQLPFRGDVSPPQPRAQHGPVLTLTPVAQCSKDISARKAKNTPQSLTNSITFGAADGVTDRPAGQTRSKTATAFAGKTAISMPATITKTESAVNAGVGELGSAPLLGTTVWLTACPVSTR